MDSTLDLTRPAVEVLSELAETLLDSNFNPHGKEGEIALEVFDTNTNKSYTLNIRLTKRPELRVVNKETPVQH